MNSFLKIVVLFLLFCVNSCNHNSKRVYDVKLLKSLYPELVAYKKDNGDYPKKLDFQKTKYYLHSEESDVNYMQDLLNSGSIHYKPRTDILLLISREDYCVLMEYAGVVELVDK